MIGLPLNDYECLGQITEVALAQVEQQATPLLEVASRFPHTVALAAWIRTLPQRDDEGQPQDGPRVEECEPSQRLRIPAPDPNCVERAALYLAAAELIDADPVRQLATIETPFGLHTIAVENGAPIILDPRVSRNAAEAGLFRIEEGKCLEVAPSQAVGWLVGLAEEPASRYPGGKCRLRNAREALESALRGWPVSVELAPDVAFTLALADKEAKLFGPQAVALMRCTIKALSELQGRADGRCARRNAPELRLGGYRIRPHAGTLGALARVGGRLGYRVGTATLQAKLASMGIPPLVIREVERELNREGLSLGALGRPPLPGSLAAMTPDALAGRWLASRIA